MSLAAHFLENAEMIRRGTFAMERLRLGWRLERANPPSVRKESMILWPVPERLASADSAVKYWMWPTLSRALMTEPRMTEEAWMSRGMW